MTLEEIEALWADDVHINKTQLGDESLNIPKLHAKYYHIYVREKLTYGKMIEEQRELQYILEQFFAKTLTDDELEEYGLVYSEKKTLKPDIPKAVANYKDMVTMNMRMLMQKEKVEFLKSILDMVKNRSFQIKDAVAMVMFEHGN